MVILNEFTDAGLDALSVAELADASAFVRAVGINCTAPEYVDELIERARSATGKPLIVYPNSGEGWDANERTWLPAAAGTTPVRVDERSARRWIDGGARLVGGCCRVMPEAIAEVASAAAAVRGSRPGRSGAPALTALRPH